jgi:hypothetical protein
MPASVLARDHRYVRNRRGQDAARLIAHRPDYAIGRVMAPLLSLA